MGPEIGESASETSFGKDPACRTRFDQAFGSGIRGKSWVFGQVPPHGYECYPNLRRNKKLRFAKGGEELVGLRTGSRKIGSLVTNGPAFHVSGCTRRQVLFPSAFLVDPAE
jgi:hypothetical protein